MYIDHVTVISVFGALDIHFFANCRQERMETYEARGGATAQLRLLPDMGGFPDIVPHRQGEDGFGELNNPA